MGRVIAKDTKLTKASILIVEDQVLVAADLAARLTSLGYSVVGEAATGSKALELLELGRPDLVLLDISLKGELDGIQTAEIIKRQWDVPVVFVTDYADRQLLKQAKPAYPFGYLLKPFQEHDLEFTLEMALYVARIESERTRAISELKLNSDALENYLNGFSLVDEDGKFIYANRAYLDMWGYDSLDEIMGTSPVNHCADPTVPERMIRALKENGSCTMQFKARRRDGSVFDVLVAAQLAHDETGREIYVGTSMDIALQVQAGEDLRRSEAMLNATQRLSKVGGWHWDVRNQKMFWTEEAYRIHGLEPGSVEPGSEEHIRLSLKCYRPEDRPIILEAFQNCQTNAVPYDLVFAFTDNHGQRKWIRTTAQPVLEHGAVTQIIGNIADITVQKRKDDLQAAQLHLVDYAADHTARELLQAFLDEAEKLTFSEIGFFHFYDDDRKIIFLQAWSTRTLANICQADSSQLHYPVSQAGVWADAVRELRPVIHNDYYKLGHRKGLPEGHAPVIRQLVVPVVRGNKPVAILGVGNKGSEYNQEDETIVQQLADLAWETIERKRTEEALSESERRFRSMVEGAPEPIFIQTDKKFAYLNPKAVGLFGAKEASELIGSNVMDRFHPAYHRAINNRIRQLNEQRLPVNNGLEQKFIRLDGSEVWVETIGQPIVYHGQSGALVFARDITERKWAEQELREREERFRNTLDNMLEGCQIIGFNWHYLYVNDTAARHGRTSKEQLVGRGIMEVYPGIEQTPLFGLMQRCMAERTPFQLENQFKFPDGSSGWFDLRLQPVPEGVFILSIDISERMQAQDEVERQRMRFKQILDQFPHGVSITDQDGRIEYANGPIIREFGEAVGLTCHEYLNGLATPCPRCTRPEVLQGKTHRLEWHSPKTGRQYELVEMPLYNDDGSVSMLQVFSDLTLRKQAEAALATSEEKYRLLVENANEVILVAQDGKLKFTNSKVVDLLGYTPGELLEKDFAAFIHPEDQNMVSTRHQQRLEGQDPPKVYNARILDRIGQTKWVQINTVRIDWEGKPATLNLLADITDHKNAVEALAASERRYRLLFDGAAEGILVAHSVNRTLLYANPAICRMLGYTAEELLQLRVDDIHPEDSLPQVRETFESYVRGDLHQTSRLPLFRKDGAVLQVEINVAAVTMDGIPCQLGFFTDVTDKARLEAEKDDLAAQLRQSQKMEAIGRLAGGVAHDFNNVLTTIMGYAQLLQMDMVEDTEPYSELEEIRKAGERAAGLTRQLLAFSRKQVLEPRVINLNDTIATMQKMLPRLVGEDILIETRLEPALNNIKVDPAQMDQVIMNLVVNARDAMPEGGLLLIESSNIHFNNMLIDNDTPPISGSYVMLAITDTGTGMDADIREHIFEPFYTTKEKGRGTGLGLATVYGIVKQSNGFVKVYSEPGRGTAFKVYMPAENAGLDTLPDQTEKLPDIHTPGKVLLVEDEEMVRRLAETILSKYGFEVENASSAEEALMIFEKVQPDLVLTDVVMTGMSGPEMIDIMKEHRPDLKFLFMSGYTEHASIRTGLVDLERCFVHKPFDAETLLNKIRRLWDV